MNVNDVRNMEFNQWIFWATALPLTVIIIALCLIWAGELENFWKGFRNIWKRTGSGGGGYIPRNTDVYSMVDPRIEERRLRVAELERADYREPYRLLYGKSRSRGHYDQDYI